jgi:xanthine dehydrogenase YagR molybdenum-binding subunit
MPRIEKTEVEFEGQVAQREIIVEDEGIAPWDEGAQLRVVGQPARRVDGLARVTGQAMYTTDVRLPGQLTAKVLRSPHSHARIASIDSSAAEALSGVHLVWHREQLPPIVTFDGRELFPNELAYEGAEVALVVAEDERAAEEALAAIDVRYESLPFVEDLDAALAEDAPLALLGTDDNWINPQGRVYERGDFDHGWEEADVKVSLAFCTPNAAHSALEPHATVARWEGNDLTVWESTQGVFSVRSELAEALDIPYDQVRVICDYMGGGFGAKQRPGRYSVLAALAARVTGRPVQLVLSRGEEQLVSGYRPASRQTVRAGAREDGTLTAIEHRAWQHMGAFGHSGYMVVGPSKELYSCPNVRTVMKGVRANTDRGRAFRAPGYVEGTFALESAMDALARKLGIDPLDLRLRNYAEEDPSRNEAYTRKGLREAYEIGAQRSGWRDRHEVPREDGAWRRGWGMASQIWGGGGGPPANAIVKLLPDGTVEVLVGVQDIGTGTKTALAQIAAEELGLPLTGVRVVLGDTLPAPYGPTSAGSQTLASAGPAVRAAARACLRDMFDLAGQMLGIEDANEDAFFVEDGDIVYGPNPEVRVGFGDVAAKADGYTLVGDGARGPNPQGKRINTFGAQFAEVAVNIDTGQVQVLKVVAVHDVGRVVNPMTATNQVYGGVIQGLGLSRMEARIVDGETGLELTSNLASYKVPTIMDVPEIEVSFVDRADAEANSIGAKGLGEPPIIPTPAALANAVSDAIGVRITDLPMTPRRIFEAIFEREAGE